MAKFLEEKVKILDVNVIVSHCIFLKSCDMKQSSFHIIASLHTFRFSPSVENMRAEI